MTRYGSSSYSPIRSLIIARLKRRYTILSLLII